MGNFCSSSDAVIIAVDVQKSSHTMNLEERSSRDLNENMRSRYLTASLRSDEFYQLSVPKFDASLPRLTEDQPMLPLRMSQCYILPEPTQTELGAIRYNHDNIEDAKEEEENRPILCVQAELPGDRETGLTILSHPLMVEASENLFVTVGIQVDNRTGTRYRPAPDRKAWCTTIQFLDHDGQELLPTIGGDLLTVGMVVDTMIKALKQTQQSVPMYLELLSEEENGKKQVLPAKGVVKKLERLAAFGATDCHLAEVDFGGLKGVLRTDIGAYQGQKILQVSYSGISYGALLRFAIEQSNIHTIYYQTPDERVVAQMEVGKLEEPLVLFKLDDQERIFPIQDSKSDLRKTEMRFVPMTDLQATRVNRLIHQGSFNKATHLLSPRQGKILMKSYSNVSQRTIAVDVPIAEAWKALNGCCDVEGCDCSQTKMIAND